jgi:methylamine utilization protein MauE
VIVEWALRLCSLGLVGLLGLAVLHKARTVASGEAHLDPLVRLRHWRPPVAARVFVVVAATELAVAAALLAAPGAGFVAAAALLIAYVGPLRALPADESCHCFGRVLQTRTRSRAIVRNLVLGATSAAGAALVIGGVAEVAPLSQATIGVALVAMAAITAPDALKRMLGGTAAAARPRRAGG